MTHTDSGDDIQYDKTTSVHPLTLIREVKKHEILYNKQLYEHTDMVKKEQVWEDIHQALFPNYNHLSEGTQNVIKRTVRKRWKSLRDALVKDYRMRIENEAYRTKKQNAAVAEMQFLIPFIKPFRFRNKNGNFSDNTIDTDTAYSPDFCKLMNETTIDLTFHDPDPDDSNVQIDDDEVVSREALYPSIRLTTSECESGEVEWKNGYCVSTPNELKPTMNYTNQNHELNESGTSDCAYHVQRKRKHMDLDSFDLQSKIVDLVDRCNTESNDEDRMFLLSLLSDFKRVPVNKKLKVKSAFVTALAEALD